jgi:pantoate--beta-alanine ligase
LKIVSTITELRTHLNSLSGVVGFVPTMGALHSGHQSLINRARLECDIVVVSAFVNPTQFLEGEDLSKYPKTEKDDDQLCKDSNVDILFRPNISDIYSRDEVSIKAPGIRGYILEGYMRPGHFDGVLQVVLKLFNIVSPKKAYFGKKDAQQLALIKQMVSNLFLSVDIVECETVRERSGLALSSRNRYLNEQEYEKAKLVSKSLFIAKSEVDKQNYSISDIKTKMKNILNGIEVQYISFVDREFQYIDQVEEGNTIILIAVKIGSTRLIDNIWV